MSQFALCSLVSNYENIDNLTTNGCGHFTTGDINFLWMSAPHEMLNKLTNDKLLRQR